MAMNNLNRTVAEVLMRAHQADWGPAGSNPNLQTTVTSETIEEQLTEQGVTIGQETINSILRELARQDYLQVSPAPEGNALTVVKVYPTRLKRDFNLWHVAEEL